MNILYLSDKEIEKTLKRYFKIIVFIILYLMDTPGTDLFSREKQYLYRHYNYIVNNPTYLIRSIEQDMFNFIWLSSDEGIYRFDGNELITIDLLVTGNKTAIPNGANLFADNSGNLWLYGNKYLYAMELSSGRVTSLLEGEFDNGLILYSISGDDNGSILLGTSFGIILMNSLSKEYKYQEYIKDIMALSTVYKGTITGALNDGRLITFDCSTFESSLITIPVKRIGRPSRIRHISDSLTLIGYKDNGGLWEYDRSSGTFRQLVRNTDINCIEPNSGGEFWMGTKDGIYIYNRGNISLLRKGIVPSLSPPESFTSTLKCDREGGMWIGTYYQGFYYLPSQPLQMQFFIPDKTHPGFKGNVVMSFCEDKYDNMWVITQDDGINRYNYKTGKFINYSKNNPENKLFSSNFYSAIAIDNELWAGSINMGIEVLDIPSGKSIRKYQAADAQGSINSNVIIAFYRTGAGELYVGTAAGLMRYNSGEDIFEPVYGNNIGGVSCITGDSKQRLWVGTWDGLYCIDKNNILRKFIHDPADSSSLRHNSVTSVFEDSRGDIYIGTHDGFDLYNNDGSFTHFILDRNTACAVNGMVEDSNNIIWGTSDNGIFLLKPDRKNLVQYINLDGNFERKLNQMPYINKYGKICFGMHNGFVEFDYKPGNIEFRPGLYITAAEYYDVKAGKHSFIYNNTSTPLRLNYRQNTIRFHYAVPAYTYMNNIKSIYRIEGTGINEWQIIDGYRPVEAHNLYPGKYTLHIKVSDLSGVWGEQELKYDFIIDPPLWKTTWAVLFYIFLIITGVVLIVRYYDNKNAVKQRTFKDEIEVQKEKELYSAKIHFFMMIAHEIRTPLTLIKIPLEHIMGKIHDESIKKDLSVIERNTERLTNLCTQLLDFRSTEVENTLKLSFVKTNIVIFVEEILYRFSSAAKEKNINMEFVRVSQSLMVAVDREIFTKICSNLINNAVKYSGKVIRIILEEDDKSVFLSVINDGQIIPEEDGEKVFTLFYRSPEASRQMGSGVGLSITKQLAEMHGGNIELLFDIEGMNHFRLTIPKSQEVISLEQSEMPLCSEPEIISESVGSEEKKTILIAEDNKELSRYLAEYFKPLYNVITVSDCTMALEILKKNTVSLVLSDIMTPGGIDGFHLCKIIKGTINLSHIPVILMTSDVSAETKIMGIEYGADAYMDKPFSVKYLAARIKNLLKSREHIYEALNKMPVNPFISTGRNSAEQQFLDDFYKLVDMHIDDPDLNMQYLAGKLNMSQSSVYKKIKELTDISPNDFIRITRLKRGAALILEGKMNIKEIAYTVGYSSPAYFATCFLRHFGMSPSEYATCHGPTRT